MIQQTGAADQFLGQVGVPGTIAFALLAASQAVRLYKEFKGDGESRRGELDDMERRIIQEIVTTRHKVVNEMHVASATHVNDVRYMTDKICDAIKEAMDGVKELLSRDA